MKTISLKLDDDIFVDVEQIVTDIKSPEIDILMRLLNFTTSCKSEKL